MNLSDQVTAAWQWLTAGSRWSGGDGIPHRLLQHLPEIAPAERLAAAKHLSAGHLSVMGEEALALAAEEAIRVEIARHQFRDLIGRLPERKEDIRRCGIPGLKLRKRAVPRAAESDELILGIEDISVRIHILPFGKINCDSRLIPQIRRRSGDIWTTVSVKIRDRHRLSISR